MILERSVQQNRRPELPTNYVESRVPRRTYARGWHSRGLCLCEEMRKGYLLLHFWRCLSVAVVSSECVFCQAGLNGGITWASVKPQWEEARRAAWLSLGRDSGLLEFCALRFGWVRSRWVFRTEALAVVITTHWLVWILRHILWESHWGSEDLDLGW